MKNKKKSMKKINLKLIFALFTYILLSIKVVHSETLEDLANELNDLRSEIAQLEAAVVTNPVVPVVNNFGKPMSGMIINSTSGNNVVTFLPMGPGTLGAKPQTGFLLNDTNVKDLAKRQSAELAAKQITEQLQAEASIDKALKEIDKASKFMEKSYKKGDLDGAIAALAFIEVSISDVSNNIPNQFKSEVVKEGKEFSKKEMDKINEITLGLNNKKEKDFEQLKESIETITDKGLEVKELTKQIIASGLEAPKLNNYYAQVSNVDLKENMKDSMKYGAILGTKVSEIDIAVRQMEAIKSGDAKKIRAIEIEKFGLAAGLSRERINAGINAIYNGDIQLEKEISKSILNKLSKNQSFNVSKMTDAEFDSYVEEQIAIQNVSQKIMDSKLDFSGDVNKNELNKLANEIGNILSGKVSESKINEIKTQIKIGTYNYGGTRNMTASIVANLNGQNYVDALSEARKDGLTNVFGVSTSRSLAARAAAVEASLSGNMSAFNELSKSTTASVNNLSISEVGKLSQTFNAAIQSDNLAKQALEEAHQIQAELTKAKSNLFDKADKALQVSIDNAFSKMMAAEGKITFDKETKQIVNTYDHESFIAARTEWSKALGKQRDLRSGLISADTALVEATTIAEVDASFAAEKAGKVAEDAAKSAENAQKAADVAAAKATEAAAQAATENASSEAKSAAADAKAAAEAAAADAKAATEKAAQAAAEKATAEAAKAAASQATKEAVENSADVAAAEAASQAKAAAKSASTEAKAAAEAAAENAKAAAEAAAAEAKAAAEAAAAEAKAAAEAAAKEAAKAAAEAAAEAAAKEAAIAAAQAEVDKWSQQWQDALEEMNKAMKEQRYEDYAEAGKKLSEATKKGAEASGKLEEAKK